MRGFLIAFVRGLVVLFLITVIAGSVGWWWLSRKTGLPPPSAIIAATPVKFSQSITVAQNHEASWRFAAPSGKLPGRLYGYWNCQGKSAGIKDAADDTLVGFKLVGPDDKVLDTLDHPTNGNFDVRIISPGGYTLVFENSGIIRRSDRLVHFDATYQPD